MNANYRSPVCYSSGRDRDGNFYDANVFGDRVPPEVASQCSLEGSCSRAHINTYAERVARRIRWFGKRELLEALDEGNCQYRRDKYTAPRMGDYLRRTNLARFIPDQGRNVDRGRFSAGTYESLCPEALANIRVDHAGARVPTTVWVERPTARQSEVAELVAAGLSNRQIADQLYLTVGTVKSCYVYQILAKSDCRSREAFIAKVRAAAQALRISSQIGIYD